jgi:PAS domain S-box-containing protein
MADMSPYQRRLGYLVAVVATIGVLLTRLALSNELAEQARMLPFVIAVMAAAWVGGLRPGLLATFLGAFLGILYIVPPVGSLEIPTLADGLNAAIFVFIGIAVSILTEALHTARRNEGERQFHTLADSVAQLVWIARQDGSRFWFNQRWYEYTGTTLEQVEGSGWQSLCDPAELPRVQASWNAALASNTPWEETYALRRKDGQMRWFLARAIPVNNPDGEITRWFGTSTDIHDRIETEKALQEADQRKDRYLATLAHELRNPLSPISSALQLWPRVANDPLEMEHLRGVIARQMKQLVRLVDDLLDVARISQGKITLRTRVVDVLGLVRESIDAIQPQIAAAGHQLTVSLPAEPIYVNGDSARITQVFSNILNNAMKYTVRKGVIGVALSRQEGQAIVSIRDNGPGIPSHMLTRIFEAFCQVDRTIDSAQGGLGIGLTLSKELVALHGGEIAAFSAGPGQGSEFVVKLPEVAAPTGVGVPPSGSSSRPNDQLPRRRILVVDDMEDCADTLAQLLRTHGQDAVSVHDGAAAVEWILENHPDAVLLDVAMPGLDGYEVARRLREHPELDVTVLIALTGYGQPDDRRRALQGGFDFHLTKPVQWEALESILLRLRERRDMPQLATT